MRNLGKAAPTFNYMDAIKASLHRRAKSAPKEPLTRKAAVSRGAPKKRKPAKLRKPTA